MGGIVTQGGGGSPGDYKMCAVNAIPYGWLKANGAAASRTAYAALFAAIGTTYGAGDGVTTFNLPNMCGEFPRGFDDGRGVDSGRVFGSAQAGQMPSHSHSMTIYSGVSSPYAAQPAGSNNVSPVQGAYSTAAAGGTSNASETRPRNVAVLMCIKF